MLLLFCNFSCCIFGNFDKRKRIKIVSFNCFKEDKLTKGNLSERINLNNLKCDLMNKNDCSTRTCRREEEGAAEVAVGTSWLFNKHEINSRMGRSSCWVFSMESRLDWEEEEEEEEDCVDTSGNNK